MAYTNAATIVSDDYVDTEDLRRAVLRVRPRDPHLRPDQLAVRRPGAGRDGPAGPPDAAGDRERAASTRPTALSVAGHPPRDETLQHPRCVYQILKRHFARYTPEMVEQACGISQETFLELCEAWTANSRPGPDHRAGLLRRLDPAQRRRAVHPHRRDHPAAAGQHGPPGRRHHGPARSRQHPGLDRHPDAVQPAARLPADAATRRTTRAWRSGWTACAPRVQGLLGPGRRLRRQPAQGVVGRRGDAGQRLLLRLPAPDHRRPRHLPHGAGHDRRQDQGLLPARAEPRRRLRARPGAATRHGQPRLARRPRPVRDRERDASGRTRPRSRPARS